MVRILSTAAAAATLFAAFPAIAQAPAYRAIPATPPAVVQNVVAGDTLWKCAPSGCTATTAAARPAILCAKAVKKVGRLDSFVVDGTAFGADDLAKCNAKAKAKGAWLHSSETRGFVLRPGFAPFQPGLPWRVVFADGAPFFVPGQVGRTTTRVTRGRSAHRFRHQRTNCVVVKA